MRSLFALTILYNQPFVVEQILLGGDALLFLQW